MPGHFIERDALGNIIQRPSLLPFLPHGPGTKEALKNTIRLSNSEDEKVKRPLTIVMADHGGPEGTRLWDSSLKPTEYSQMLKDEAPGRMVRSVHLHCYSGAMLADPSRTPPKKQDELWPFLEKNYHPLHCGLSRTSAKEVAWYWYKSYKNGSGPWKDVLSKMKNPSITSLAQYLSNNDEHITTPYTTSSYFTEDIFNLACQEWGKDNEQQNECEKQNEKIAIDLFLGMEKWMKKNWCQLGSSSEVEQCSEKILKIDGVLDDIDMVIARFGVQFMKNNWKKLGIKNIHSFQQYVQKLTEIETLNAAFNDPNRQKTLAPEDYDRWAALTRQLPASFELLQKELQERDDFKKYVEKNFNKKWFDSSSFAYPRLKEYPRWKNANPFTLKYKLLEDLMALQKEKKRKEIQARRYRSQVAHLWLRSLPDQRPLKLLKDIENCENSILNN